MGVIKVINEDVIKKISNDLINSLKTGKITIMGAIGVSGGSVVEDIQIAQAGLE